jgi:hypothetical protein
MIKRIHAFKTIFNLLLTVVELLIGVGYLVNMFGSNSAIASIGQDVHSVLGQINYGSSWAASSISLEGPASLLIMILGFMIFSFILITILPGMTKRIEGDIEEES